MLHHCQSLSKCSPSPQVFLATLCSIMDELSLRPENTHVGRSSKGVDFLGYYTPLKALHRITAQKKSFEKVKQRYAQGGTKPLQDYLKRWRTWVHAGLPSLVHQVDDTIEQLFDAVISSKGTTNSQRLTQRSTSMCNLSEH